MAQRSRVGLQLGDVLVTGILPVRRVIVRAFVIYWAFCRRRPLGGITSMVLVLIGLTAIFAGEVSPYDPLEARPQIRNLSPNAEHWAGTDTVGRDILSRIVHGSRLSLMVGFGAIMAGTTTGALWGLASGYLGGKFDLITQRIIEVWMSFPSLVLAMSLLVVMGAGVRPVVIAAAFTRVPYGCRVIRSVAIATREFEFVESARAIGASNIRIMLVHVLPSCVPSFLILASAHIGIGIMLEATLGFLGVGIPPPTPSWGNMLSREVLISLRPMWWMVLAPGVPIVITVLCFNLFGDAIRDVLDPKLRGEH